MNAADAMKLLALLTEATLRAQAARAEIRRIAEQAGVTQADLDASDARLMRHYDFSGPAEESEP